MSYVEPITGEHNLSVLLLKIRFEFFHKGPNFVVNSEPRSVVACEVETARRKPLSELYLKVIGVNSYLSSTIGELEDTMSFLEDNPLVFLFAVLIRVPSELLLSCNFNS